MVEKLLLRLPDYGRSGHQNKAPRRKSLCPTRNTVDGHRIEEPRTGGAAATLCGFFERGQTAINLHSDLDRVDGGLALCVTEARMRRDIGYGRMRCRTVVVEKETAAREIGERWLERHRIGEESPAQKIGDAGIAGETCHRPEQALCVGIIGDAGSRRMRTQIAV